MKAFEERDAQVARTIWEQDREVDHRHYVIQRDLMELLEESKAIPALVVDQHILQRITYLLWIAHKLERASDHCTNICERIVFMVEGATDIAIVAGDEWKSLYEA
jgi:phosphate transport system protein